MMSSDFIFASAVASSNYVISPFVDNSVIDFNSENIVTLASPSYDSLFDAIRQIIPDWVSLSALIIGLLFIFLILVKVNPLFTPIRKGLIWLFDLFEDFLQKDNPDPSGKNEK